MKTSLRKLLRPFTGPLVLMVSVSLAMLSQQAAAAEKCCWINAKTGKPYPDSSLVPLGMTTLDFGVDPNHFRIPPTDRHPDGSNWVRDSNDSWINAKTGKTYPCSSLVPLGMTTLDFRVDPNHFRIPPTDRHPDGSNWVRVPCPEEKLSHTTGGVKIAPSSSALFRTGEVQWNLYGLGGTGQGVRNVTETKTTERTVTISETQTVLVDVPGTPGLVPRDVTTTRDMKVKHTERHTRNTAPIQGGFGGAGAEAKVFVTRNLGLGLEGDWLDGGSSLGTALGTVTARFPLGPCAPYVFGGAGVQFGDRTQAVGKLGGGLEHRFSPQTGVFVDAAWMFSEHENAAVFRAGVSLIR